MRGADYNEPLGIERVSISQAVQISGLKMRTLQNLAAQGVIPGAAKPAGRWTFDIAQLRQWARQTPENTLPCRKTSLSVMASTGAVSKSPDAYTASRYMSVLSQSGAQRQGRSKP